MLQQLQDISLTDNLKRVIKIAQAIAKENMNSEFMPAHLLKALLNKDAGLHPLLNKLNKDVYYLEEWADVRIEAIGKSFSLPDIISGDRLMSEVVNEADNVRVKLSKDAIEPLHTLTALCTPGVGFTYEQLKTFPLCRDELIVSVADDDEMQTAFRKDTNNNQIIQEQKSGQHALLKYCIDRSLLAKQGKLDTIVGRDKEIRMMAEILTRRSKPNVLIVGEPGVGKSALVDGFTYAILNQKVPQHLLNSLIFELDFGALVAGASYKGEVEDRLKNILKEIKQFDKAILFIDEIHALLDKHSAAAGSVNLLKPELARGEITVIAATTLDEYRRYMQTDEAFSRRFELLTLEEPDADTCFRMIKAVIPYYEKHHGITVSDDVIYETIRFAKRYVKDRKLPDAAIDLADRTMAALAMINDVGSKDIDEVRNRYDKWCNEVADNKRSLEDWLWFYRQVSQDISPILSGYIQSEVNSSEMMQASDVKIYLDKALDVLKEAALNKRISIEKSDVAAIISHKTGIPIGKVQTKEREKLLNMEASLT